MIMGMDGLKMCVTEELCLGPASVSLTAGLLALSLAHQTTAQSFSADSGLGTDVSGEAGFAPNAINLAAPEVSGEEFLERQDLNAVTSLPRTCGCPPSGNLDVNDIREISDRFVADGNAVNSFGMSNMVWGFGQFLDHDLALTIEEEEDEGTPVAVGAVNAGDPMEIQRVISFFRRGCSSTLNVHTGRIDAGPVYGADEAYVQETLRERGTCRLRVAEGDFLPLTSATDEKGRFFFIAGDVRVSEHAFLSAQHIVWLREHNRICAAVDSNPTSARLSADERFNLVRNVVIAKFQQVVLTEFLPAFRISQADLENANGLILGPDVSMEFSIAYRLGHDLIGNTVGGISITDAFDGEKFFLDASQVGGRPRYRYKANADSLVNNIMLQLSTTPATEIDGRLSDALRNFLFGREMAEDLAGRNIFRGRDLGVPTYAGVAQCFGVAPNAATEAETPDLWLGLLREPKVPGFPIGPTLRAVLIEQFHRSFFGPGGFFWRDDLPAIGMFEAEIASSTYARIISANTGAAVSGNVFAV